MAKRSLIISGVGAAWRFLVPAWRRGWGAMLCAGAVLGAVLALQLWRPRSPWRLEALLIAVAAAVMAQGGLYRLALDRGRPGPAGLQWGGVEWRLGAVLGLTAVFLSVLGMLAFVVVLAFAFGVASSGHGFVTATPATWATAVDGRGRVVVAAVGGSCFAGLIWAGVRVSFGSVASVDRGRIQMLASWPSTRRLVAPIVVGRILLAVVPIGFAAVVLTGMAGASHPPAALYWAASLAAGLAITGLWLPLSVGLMAYLYRHSPTA